MRAQKDVVEVARELVRIASVNPMGRGLEGPTIGEGRLGDYLEQFFQQLEVPVERQQVSPGRVNIVATADVPGSAHTVLFEVHQDTVPVDNMSIPAFDAQLREGKVWGRGACDVKGGMAAMLHAFERLVREKPSGAARLVLACTVDEEHTFSGIRHFLSQPQQASMAVVAEPTQLEVVIAHKGLVRWKVKTKGRSCHSASPERGVNAIYRMAPVLEALSEYAVRLGQGDQHQLLGPPTLSVGVIRGGTSVNTVPAECEIEIDRRIIPGEDPAAAFNEARQFVFARPAVDPGLLFDEPWLMDPYLDTAREAKIVSVVSAAVDQIEGKHIIAGVPYGTDGSKIADAGIPAVVFGPGDIAQAHTEAEWIDVEQLRKASEIYYQIIRIAG